MSSTKTSVPEVQILMSGDRVRRATTLAADRFVSPTGVLRRSLPSIVRARANHSPSPSFPFVVDWCPILLVVYGA